jgi:hypothetical protein
VATVGLQDGAVRARAWRDARHAADTTHLADAREVAQRRGATVLAVRDGGAP